MCAGFCGAKQKDCQCTCSACTEAKNEDEEEIDQTCDKCGITLDDHDLRCHPKECHECHNGR